MSVIFSHLSVFEPGIITKPGRQHETQEAHISQYY